MQLFDLVAAPYDLFYHAQRIAFRRAWRAHGGRLGLAPGACILDVGCGIGSLASVLAQLGYRLTALDRSRLMCARAKRHLRGTGVAVVDRDAVRGLPFGSGAFDLVVASHVAHGLQPADRAVFYREALRVSKGLVLLSDYPPRALRRGRPDVHVIEALERSDYRKFIRAGTAELRVVFASVEIFVADIGSAWYVCRGPRGGSG